MGIRRKDIVIADSVASFDDSFAALHCKRIRNPVGCSGGTDRRVMEFMPLKPRANRIKGVRPVNERNGIAMRPGSFVHGKGSGKTRPSDTRSRQEQSPRPET